MAILEEVISDFEIISGIATHALSARFDLEMHTVTNNVGAAK
jgi:hypothetical protein